MARKHTKSKIIQLILHLSAFSICYLAGINWYSFFIFILMYYIKVLGISIAHHRYFSHRSFKTSRFFQCFLALWGGLANQRGALWWAARHRHHHRTSDTPEDWHSPQNYSFFYSHIGWLLDDKARATDYDEVKDFKNFRELIFINEKTWIPFTLDIFLVLLFSYILKLSISDSQIYFLQMIAWGTLAANIFAAHTILLVNSISHIYGTKDFESKDESRNNWWLLPFLLGENWHNNHHAFPNLAGAGLLKYQFDISFYIILIFEKLGLVWDVKKPSLFKNKIESKKLNFSNGNRGN